MGLDSIALAVAHLEERGAADSEEQSGPAIPPPKSLGRYNREAISESIVAPRIVSVELAASSSTPSSADEGEGHFSLNLSYYNQNKESPHPLPSPDEVITHLNKHDVLCGRGGETNNNVGNLRYRKLVKREQLAYLQAKRRDKPLIARFIVETVRKEGGRFLKKVSASNTWRDVGNIKAREKTSQALREGAPELRVLPSVSIGSLDETGSSKRPACARVSPPRKKQRMIEIKQRHVLPMDISFPQVSPVSSTDDEDLRATGDSSNTTRGPRLRIFKARMSISS